MKKNYIDQLTKSLEQAAEYRNGNRKAARAITRTLNIPKYDAKAIAEIRNKLALTQKGLANVIGVSPRTVEAWETGVNLPNGSANRLLYLLGTDKPVSSLLEAQG